MPIKESSDELNPPVVVGGSDASKPRAARSPKDYLALAIATCGVGYLPLAPGTWGSLVGVAFFLVLRTSLYALLWEFPRGLGPMGHRMNYAISTLELATVAVIAAIGVWAGSRAEKVLEKKDPGKVVIDEVAGQLLALVALPMTLSSWMPLLIPFVLFRFFDIVKPYPARRLESLPGGLGIMADDLIAGGYAALGTMLIVTGSWFI